jgi:hypothetical protein
MRMHIPYTCTFSSLLGQHPGTTVCKFTYIRMHIHTYMYIQVTFRPAPRSGNIRLLKPVRRTHPDFLQTKPGYLITGSPVSLFRGRRDRASGFPGMCSCVLWLLLMCVCFLFGWIRSIVTITTGQIMRVWVFRVTACHAHLLALALVAIHTNTLIPGRLCTVGRSFRESGHPGVNRGGTVGTLCERTFCVSR